MRLSVLCCGLVISAAAMGQSVGLTPLNELATGKYKDFVGGLYADGKNEPWGAHAEALKRISAAITSLDAAGKPAVDGKIGLVGIGASVCRQIFETLEEKQKSEGKSASPVVFINGARGGHDVNKISDPDKAYWAYVKKAVEERGLTAAQVQVAWYQSDDLKDPRDDFPGRPRRLQEAIARNMQEAKATFPNLRICYHSARHTTAFIPGDTGKTKHSEPRAWHVGWSVKWLIEAQASGKPELAFEGDNAKLPLVAWATYFWTDGDKPRSNGYRYGPADTRDGVHLAEPARSRVAGELLNFWASDPYAKSWFAPGKQEK